MGSSSFQNLFNQFNSNNYDWEIINRKNFYCKVRDRKSGRIGELYTIDSFLVQETISSYIVRHKYSEYLVDVYDIVSPKQQTFCTSQRQISLVIEHIPYRLGDIGSITFDEALYILRSVLKSCEIIINNNILLYPFDQNNICFNIEGKCKFWINQNLARSKPNIKSINEQKFVQELFEIIEDRIIQQNDNYYQKKSKIYPLDIKNALRFVAGIKVLSLNKIQSLYALRQIHLQIPLDVKSTNHSNKASPNKKQVKKISVSKSNMQHKKSQHQITQKIIKNYQDQSKIIVLSQNHDKKFSLSSKLKKNTLSLIQTKKSYYQSEKIPKGNEKLSVTFKYLDPASLIQNPEAQLFKIKSFQFSMVKNYNHKQQSL